jgi:hypothetical protein
MPAFIPSRLSMCRSWIPSSPCGVATDVYRSRSCSSCRH